VSLPDGLRRTLEWFASTTPAQNFRVPA